MAVRRQPGPDWGFVSWHYGAIHRSVPVWHDPLVTIRAKGLENLPKSGGFLYAANHASAWDPIVLQTTCPRPVNWLAKKELLGNAFGRWFFGRGGCIPVDRKAGSNAEAFGAALQALADGRIIGVFPEGSRGQGTLTLREPKTGVGRLALGSGAPVVPAAIVSDRFWPKGRRAPQLREPVYLNVGAPMTFDASFDAKAVAEQVMKSIGVLLAEAAAARDAREPWPKPRR